MTELVILVKGHEHLLAIDLGSQFHIQQKRS